MSWVWGCSILPNHFDLLHHTRTIDYKENKHEFAIVQCFWTWSLWSAWIQLPSSLSTALSGLEDRRRKKTPSLRWYLTTNSNWDFSELYPGEQQWEAFATVLWSPLHNGLAVAILLSLCWASANWRCAKGTLANYFLKISVKRMVQSLC